MGFEEFKQSIEDVSARVRARVIGGVPNMIERIEWLRQHGSSLVLCWAEDPVDHWEASWISSGKRHNAVGLTLEECLGRLPGEAPSDDYEAHQMGLDH